MSYAIKIDADSGEISLSKSILEETKRLTILNFAFFEGGFSFYFSKKGRDLGHHRLAIDKETKIIKSSHYSQLLCEAIGFQNDWKIRLHKDNLIIEDKYQKKRIYVVYLEKITDGCFRTLTNSSNSIQSNNLKYSLSPSKKKILVFDEEVDNIKNVFTKQYYNESYNLNNKLFHYFYQKYSPTDLKICNKNNFIGYKVLTSIIGKKFIVLNTIKAINSTIFSSENSTSIVLSKFGRHIKYLYPKIEIIKVEDKEELYVSFLSYNRLLDLYYNHNVSLTDSLILFKNSKRQNIKLTKYIQALDSSLTAEQVKEEYDKIMFYIKPFKPDIKEVKGEEIVYWYNEKNYMDFDKTSVLFSCMRYAKYAECIRFYAKNKNASLLILTVGDKLVGRAIIWDCVDGTRVMDRPYVLKESDYIIFENYRKDNNILFAYDYRKRVSSNSKGYGVGQFSNEYSRNFEIKLDYIPKKTLDHFTYIDEFVLHIVNHTGTYDLPYFDNFSFIDIENNLLLNPRDINAYKLSLKNYFKCEVSGDILPIKYKETLLDGRNVSKKLTVYSKYYNGIILVEETTIIDNDYILLTDCEYINKKWVIKNNKKEKEEIKFLINNEELEYVDEIAIA